jgi:hypothetical protein
LRQSALAERAGSNEHAKCDGRPRRPPAFVWHPADTTSALQEVSHLAWAAGPSVVGQAGAALPAQVAAAAAAAHAVVAAAEVAPVLAAAAAAPDVAAAVAEGDALAAAVAVPRAVPIAAVLAAQSLAAVAADRPKVTGPRAVAVAAEVVAVMAASLAAGLAARSSAVVAAGQQARVADLHRAAQIAAEAQSPLVPRLAAGLFVARLPVESDVEPPGQLSAAARQMARRSAAVPAKISAAEAAQRQPLARHAVVLGQAVHAHRCGEPAVAAHERRAAQQSVSAATSPASDLVPQDAAGHADAVARGG